MTAPSPVGIRPGDPLHTECRDGVVLVECAWPGELTNPGGPSNCYARPGDEVWVGDAMWRVSDRPRVPSATQTAAPREVRYLYASAILMMDEGADRRAEIRQMLVDLLDVVEQSPDEAPLIAALAAYDEVAGHSRPSLADAVERSIIKLSPLPATGAGCQALAVEVAKALGAPVARVAVTLGPGNSYMGDGLTVELRSPGGGAEFYHRERLGEVKL